MIRKYTYTALDGNHWADAEKGDHLYYSINIAPWITSEGGELVKINWDVPVGTTGSDEYIEDSIASIKIETNYVGTYKIVATIESIAGGRSQSNSVPMLIKVY